jgi:hypothetical protein
MVTRPLVELFAVTFAVNVARPVAGGCASWQRQLPAA